MLASRKYVVRTCVGVAGALLLGTLVLAQGRPTESKVLALVGGRVITQTEAGTIEATIVIRDGKVEAVKPGALIPSDATKIDIKGMVVTPGLIDARSSLWLTPAANQDTSSDAGLEILDEVDPTREDWKHVARQGVTAVYVQPSSSSLLGGRGAVLRVGPGTTVEDVVIKGSAAAQASLGGTPPAPVAPEAPAGGRGRRGGRGRGQQADVVQAAAPASTGNSLTRYAQYEQLKRTLEAAQKYDEDWKKVEKADLVKKGSDKGAKDKQGAEKKASATKTAVSSLRMKHDPAKDFLRKVISNQIPLRLEAHREDDVVNALRLAKETKIRLILDGVSNPRAAGEAIIAAGVPLVLGPFADVEETSAIRSDRSADWPKSLTSGDGRFAIGTFSNQPRGSRLLRVHAANAVALGLDPNKVLRAITVDAAEILGVADRIGTIAAGKDADLVVFAGDPLDPSTPVRLTISGGKVTYDAGDLKVEPALSAGELISLSSDLAWPSALRGLEFKSNRESVDLVVRDAVKQHATMGKVDPASLHKLQRELDDTDRKLKKSIDKADMDDYIEAKAFLSSVAKLESPESRNSGSSKNQKSALPLSAKLPKKFALKSNRILKENGSYQAGVVLVENGKIRGLETVAPEGYPTYELGSAVIAPGLVASFNDLGMHSSIDDAAEADAGQIRTADVLDPHYRPLRELIEGGYTSALFAPGSVNVIAGAPCGVRLGASDPLLGDEGLCFVLAASARESSRASDDPLAAFGIRRGGRNAPRYPGSLAGQIQLIEHVLSGKAPSTELYVPRGVRQQMQTARERSVKPLLEQKGIAFFEAHNRAEVGAALQLIERFKLRAVLVNPVDIRPFLDDIKRLGVGIVASTVHSASNDRALQELVAASQAAIPVSFGCGSAQDMRTTAALAVNAGMSREAAWRGLTTTAAKSAGLPDSFGRIVPGAAADLVIWDGSPLDLRSRPVRVLVEGQQAFASH